VKLFSRKVWSVVAAVVALIALLCYLNRCQQQRIVFENASTVDLHDIKLRHPWWVGIPGNAHVDMLKAGSNTQVVVDVKLHSKNDNFDLTWTEYSSGTTNHCGVRFVLDHCTLLKANPSLRIRIEPSRIRVAPLNIETGWGQVEVSTKDACWWYAFQ
jgi:hypothetical protein